jgi:hypothetical protein
MAVVVDELPCAAFTMLRNCWLRDVRIGYKAKGLLGYLRSHATGYRCSQAQMVRESSDGRAAVRAALDELEAAGYLERIHTRDGGRYAETDYRMRDPFDAYGHLSKTDTPDGRRSPETAPGTEIEPGTGGTVSDYPRRKIAPIEEQGEKNTPSPTEKAHDPGERHLTPIGGPTAAERAKTLATEHWEGVGKVPRYMGIQAIVRCALDAGHTDEQIRAALAALRRQGRNLTQQSLGLLIADPARANGRTTHRPTGRAWFGDLGNRDGYDVGNGTF